MNKGKRVVDCAVAVAAVLGFWCSAAAAQERGATTRDDAALVVDGTVREIFASPRSDRVDYLVEIEVKRVQADRVPRTPPRVAMPAPGDFVYVYVRAPRGSNGQGQGIAGQNAPAAESRVVMPVERAQIRAYLNAGTRGGWEGAGAPWFEPTANVLAEANPADSAPAAPEMAPTAPTTRPEPAPAGGKSALATLGFTGESLTVKGQFVIRVLSVEQGGTAQQSGLEAGDVVIGANERPLTGLDQLDQLARQGTLANLLVLDVNTGKVARVRIATAGGRPASEVPPVVANAPDAPATTPKPTAPAAAKSLGISAEPVAVGRRTGMKVIRVEPGSPAQTAGIEVGDVIVAANGVAVTGVEVLSAVLKKSGSNLTLTVRDTRTGRDVPVEVKMGGTDAVNPAPAPVDAPVATDSGRKLGAVTELVFYDINPAVKVTEVEPNSPAARAGIEPGDIILEANGTPVLHPKALDEAVRKSGPTLKLQVVDPSNNKKTPVDVNLGG
jgi:S1-C subfamily serine protease